MVLETNFKVKVVKWYFENAKSIDKTQRACKLFYNTKKAPARKSILYIVKKMAVLVENLTQPDIKLSGRLKTSENLKKFEDSQHRASRRLEKETGINRCTVRRILNDGLGVFPQQNADETASKSEQQER